MTDTAGHPSSPLLPGVTQLRESDEDAMESLLADLLIHAKNCVRTFGDFQLALPGDECCIPLYRRLMYGIEYRWLPWKRTHLWLIDERIDDEGNVSKAPVLRDFLVDHAGLPPEQFHVIEPSGSSPAREYEVNLQEVLSWRERGQDRLDYVLLGLVPGGGMAGFPGGWSPETVTGKLVCAIEDEDPGRGRSVTMTHALMNAARFIAILGVGSAARALLRNIDGCDWPVEGIPLTGIDPVGGEMHWYLDEAACGREEELDHRDD